MSVDDSTTTQYMGIYDEAGELTWQKSTTEEDIFVADMFKDMKGIQLIMYIDEESGELSKYEIDLSPIISSIFGSLSETEGIPVEDDFMLNNLKANMVVEIDNINNATFFEIPVEALEAPEIKELQ